MQILKNKKKVGYKAPTKGGAPDYKIRYSFDKDAIIDFGRIKQ